MKVLVAPLNWGLGHASRCVPLIHRLLDEGHEVILGGDGDSLTLLRKHFPKLRYTYLVPLNLRYGKGKRQVWAMLKALPKLHAWSIKDHAMLQAILREEHIDQVISDNRFGLYSKQTECVYLTHQLHIMLPRGWKWAEGIASRLHARIYARFNKVWVPDYEDITESLAGEMSHPKEFSILSPQRARLFQNSEFSYIGPLSRFDRKIQKIPRIQKIPNYEVVAVLSGLEPHRTMLEQEIVQRFTNKKDQVLIVQGLMGRPQTTIKRGNITIAPSMNDAELEAALKGAKHIIARSGYSTIMDLAALGLLRANSQKPTVQLELIPTPGQPEQEYLASLHNKMQ